MVHKALSKFLIIDINKFLNLFDIFYELLNEDIDQFQDEEDSFNLRILQNVSLRVFFDSLFVHNLLQAMNSSKNTATTGTSISHDDLINVLTKALFSRDIKTVECATEGFAKLILHQRIYEPIDHLTYMIVLWHEKNTKRLSLFVPQYLTTFFNIYTSSKIEFIDNYEEAFEKLFQ